MLAAIVFLIGIELVDIPGMRRVLRLRPDEFVVATLVAVTVVAVGVEQGIVLAIVASVIGHLRRSYRPTTNVMQLAASGHWKGLPTTSAARTLPGLVVYRFAGSLYYANANLFFEQTSAFATAADPPRWLCIDAAAIPDIDYSGGETIRQLVSELEEHGIKVVVAEPMQTVRDDLDRYGLTEILGEDALFETVGEAVQRFNELESAGNG